MKTWILSLLVVLSGCAHVGQDAASSSRAAALLDDAAFAPPRRASIPTACSRSVPRCGAT